MVTKTAPIPLHGIFDRETGRLLSLVPQGSVGDAPDQIVTMDADAAPLRLSASQAAAIPPLVSGAGNPIPAIFLGDSKTAQAFIPVAAVNGYVPRWCILGNAALGWPMTPINGGVSGDTTAQMLARLPALLSANPGAGWLVIRGMTNDIGNGNLVASDPTGSHVTKEMIVANLQSCITLGLAAGKRIALCTEHGNGAGAVNPINAATTQGALQRAAFAYVNSWIRRQCAANGWPLVDIELAMMDPATGLPVAGSVQTDGIHPSYVGGSQEARAMVRAFQGILPVSLRSVTSRLSPANLLGPVSRGAGAVTADAANDTRIIAPATASVAAWAATTAYTLGQLVIASGRLYVATAAGTSGSVAPVHTAGQAADGTVVWKYVASGALPGIPSGWSISQFRAGGGAAGVKVGRASLGQGTVASMAFTSTASFGGAGFYIGGDPANVLGRWDLGWAASTAYAVGRRINANGMSYVCTATGTTGGTDPTAGWSTQEGALVTDGATFLCQRKPLAGELLVPSVDIDTSSLVGNVSLRLLLGFRDTGGTDTVSAMLDLDLSGSGGVAGTWLPSNLRIQGLPFTVPSSNIRYLFVSVAAYGENGSSATVTVNDASVLNISV